MTVTDPLEEALPVGGPGRAGGSRDRARSWCSTPPGPEGRAFAEDSRRAREAREALLRRLKLDAITVRTDRPYLPALTAFFEARARRLRH